MPFEFTLTRPVEFADTDMAGIVHFANFFRYMEACEAAFFRSLGLALIDGTGTPRTGWPRVRATCDYLEPLCFGDTVEVHLLVKEVGRRALSYAFRFHKPTPGAGPVAVARGELTVVYAAIDAATGRMTARDLPPDVRAKIEAAPPAARAR